MSSTDSSTEPDQVFLCRDGDALCLGNRQVELVIDAHNGHFRHIRNRQTDIEHKRPNDGVWPFGITVGTRDQPQQMRAEIRAGATQEMTYSFAATPAGSQQLQLVYPMLVDQKTGEPTGVGLGVTIKLLPDRDYFSIRAEIANGGPWWLTQFYAGRGALHTGDASRQGESVWMPTRGGASYEEFSHTTLGQPTYGWGWTDYSGARSGIGMAYINRQGIQWCFDWDKTEAGLSTSWRLFDLSGYWHFESLMNEAQKKLRIQPLEPGNTFVTDEWLLIPHAGDWHRTADVYRQHFNEAFAGDGLTWDTLPQKARELDIYVGFWIAENLIGNSYPRQLYNHLDTVAPQMESFLREVGADPGHVGVGLTWFHSQVGRYPVSRLRAGRRRSRVGRDDPGIAPPASELHRRLYAPIVPPPGGPVLCTRSRRPGHRPLGQPDRGRPRLRRQRGLGRPVARPAHSGLPRPRARHGVHGRGAFPLGNVHGERRGPFARAQRRRHSCGQHARRAALAPTIPPGVGAAKPHHDRRLRRRHRPLGRSALRLPQRPFHRLHAAGAPLRQGLAGPARRQRAARTHRSPAPTAQRNQRHARRRPIRQRGAAARSAAARPGGTAAFWRNSPASVRRQRPRLPTGFSPHRGADRHRPKSASHCFSDAAGITVVYYAEADVGAEIQLDAAQLGQAKIGRQTRPVELQQGMLDFWVVRREE